MSRGYPGLGKGMVAMEVGGDSTCSGWGRGWSRSRGVVWGYVTFDLWLCFHQVRGLGSVQWL